jgi:hypothetical protein
LRDQRLAALASQEELDRLRQEITALRKANEAAAKPEPDLSEFDTRRGYIDYYLEEAGWVHGRSCTHEHEVQGMPNATGRYLSALLSAQGACIEHLLQLTAFCFSWATS